MSTTASAQSYQPRKKSSHRERLLSFLGAYREFDSETSLHRYYLSYDDQTYLTTFWADILRQYQEQVSKSFTLKLSQVMKDFTLHDRVPLAVPDIILQEAHLVLREEITSGRYYSVKVKQDEQSQSMLSYLGQKLYENTLGYYLGEEKAEATEEQEYTKQYVNVEMLDKVATGIQRWADESRERQGAIVEEGQLRKVVRKALYENEFTDVEENVDLILMHLRGTGRLATGAITMSGKADLKIAKLAPMGTTLHSQEISTEEAAPFQIRELIADIDKQIASRTQRVQEMNHQTIQIMKAGDKIAASKILKQRKNIEKYLRDLANRKYHLEEVLLGIEQGQQDQMMFESLKAASEAGKQIQKGASTGSGDGLAADLQELMSEIREQQQEQSEMSQLFIDQTNLEDEADIMKELAELNKADTEKEKPISKQPEITTDELTRRLQALEIPTTPIKTQEPKEAVLV